MMQFTKEYQETLHYLWNKYIKSDEPLPESIPEIRPIIYESWKRAKNHKVSPLEVKDKMLSKAELSMTLSYNKDLIAVSHSYIQSLYTFIKGSNFIIALTDLHGNVIDIVGQDTLIKERARKSGLTIGCNRSEEYAGTSGIGTCLATGQPIQIWGCEHYIQPHHNYVCSAAPIRNESGDIIGCLDIIGPMEAVSTHTLGMVCAAVDGIGKEIKMRDAYQKIFVINNQLNSTVQSITSGILMFDNMGIITQYNNRAAHILRLPSDSLQNQNIANILNMQTATLNLLEISKNINNKEFFVVNSMGQKLNLSISASIIYNDLHDKISTVLVIDELQRIHDMINKISGFTAKCTFDSIIGDSSAILEMKHLGSMASQSDSNVLILGESGTGKDLLAQSIHNASSRSKGPFIAINCGSLPKGLIESELFGYEGGAFTGANKEGYTGKFELANGGTIFLDEIGDMPLEMQATLLRVIQTKKIVRIGGKTPKQIDVRIIAATNRDLQESIKNNRFRNDLYYRLNVLTFEIPPLRKRKEDIPVLIDHFIKSYGRSMNRNIKGLSNEALNLMTSYDWPGNVRELENAIERALNLVNDEWITESELSPEIIQGRSSNAGAENVISPGYNIHMQSRRNKEYDRIIQALYNENGNVSNASAALDIPKRTLYRKIKKYAIDVSEFRDW